MTCAPAVAFDWSFPREYEIQHPAAFGDPEKLPQIYYPGASREGGSADLAIRVIPMDRSPWIACFTSSGLGGSNPTIMSTPNPRKFCAVSYGAAYFVNADNPDDWSYVEEVCPTLNAWAVPHQNFLLFADYTHLGAYGPDGPVWISERVCWDWLRVAEITQDTIKGVGFDAPRDNEEAPFAVELRTGRILFCPFQELTQL
jgi:hypothetical protein